MIPGLRADARLLFAAAAGLAALACGRGETGADRSPTTAPIPTTPAASASASGPARGDLRGPAAAAPVAALPAPGTLSLRFVARARESGVEIPAGSFEVRLLSLDAIRGEGDKGVKVDKAPAGPVSSPAPAYQGRPEQVLVTQPDGSRWTFVAGVRPGLYALRITAKGRRMLLEVLTVKAEDRLVERRLEPES